VSHAFFCLPIFLQELNELDEEADLPLEELLARWVRGLAGLE
jgi:hypothetical protein